jgi:hypothetical protein
VKECGNVGEFDTCDIFSGFSVAACQIKNLWEYGYCEVGRGPNPNARKRYDDDDNDNDDDKKHQGALASWMAFGSECRATDIK